MVSGPLFKKNVLFTTIAAQRWLSGYDHGNGYDHDCCGSTTAAITTLAMVTIAAAMATMPAMAMAKQVLTSGGGQQ